MAAIATVLAIAALALNGSTAALESEPTGASGSTPLGVAGMPEISWRPIPFGAERRAQMRRYSERHYGLGTWRLGDPAVIVEHMAAMDSADAVFDIFAANEPDPEVGEYPGVCTHFLVTEDGSVIQFVRTEIMCRHTVGLNYTSIGIEHLGSQGSEVLGDSDQLRGSLKLTRWLVCSFGIQIGNVVGHNESRDSPFYVERDPEFRGGPIHTDWNRDEMERYRHELQSLGPCT